MQVVTIAPTPTPPTQATHIPDDHQHFCMQNSPGVLSAREFVWWYNGHPEFADLQMNLGRITSVAICGLGNVAVDCARILLQSPERLASTDIADHALRQLRASSVQQVHLIGRRGPVQVSSTWLSSAVALQG